MELVEGEAVSLVDGREKVLVPGGSSPRYAESGHIVYASGDALWAIRFDHHRLEVIGDPRPVVEGVVTKGSGAANFDIAANGSLLYATGSRVDRAAVLVWVDREGHSSESWPGISNGSY
jgi:hypothetical protein